ncbi:hypothetical protein JRQ81_015973, partial [Phrynocephalus forsythii]
ISREPKFISKRRVPYYSTQVSESFEWNGANYLEKDTSSEFKVHQPLELHLQASEDYIDQEKIKTPDAPRLPEKIQLDRTGSRCEITTDVEERTKSSLNALEHKNRTLGYAGKDSGKISNGLKRILQRRAGMNISRSGSFPRSSEYQRQFVWKTPQKLSPVIAADQFIHSSSPSVPPFKSPFIVSETEYERSFKASAPMKELKQQKCLEEGESPESQPVEISLGEKDKKLEAVSKMRGDPAKQNKSETKQKEQKQKPNKPFCLHRSSKKMSTEYRSNFLSPAQYMYKDGTWLHIRKNMPDQVKELREKAEGYRRRSQGTHFSRDHLNQILSDKNKLWDLSSDSSTEEAISSNVRALDLAGVVPDKKLSPDPQFLLHSQLSKELQQSNTEKLGTSDAATVPAKRRLVWGESGNDEQLEDQSQALREEGKKHENQQELEEAQELEESSKDIPKDDEHKENVNPPDGNMSDSASASSRGVGRLPTPQLRALGGAQRTHHDLTTPATGGAVLVSPPKMKSLSSLQIRKESSGKHDMANKQVSKEDFRRKSNMDEGDAVSVDNCPTAGLKTADPLPLRKERRTNPDASDTVIPLEQTSVVPGCKSARTPAVSYWSPSCRIKGSLNDPEFQHNGNVASPQRSWLQLPLQERNYHDEDEDDRLSQLSARSAASSSLASQVLERAQKRKENFWGKM